MAPKQDVLEKIKKLLALSRSPNANEAACALRRAQEMMEASGLNQEDIAASEIIEEQLSRKGGAVPPAYESYLVKSITRGFGCRIFLLQNWNDSDWTFVGLAHRTEVAKYLAVVLLRKLHAARKVYLQQLRRCKRTTKTRRADEFCLGWVATVAEKLQSFVGTEEELSRLDLYMSQHHDLVKQTPIRRKVVSRFEANDFSKGADEGRGVELHHGVRGQKDPRSLLA